MSRVRLRQVGSRLPPTITYNGAVVLSGHAPSVLLRHLIDRQSFTALVQVCRDRGVPVLAYACKLAMDFTPEEKVYGQGVHYETEFNGMPVHSVEDLTTLHSDFVAVLLERPQNLDLGPFVSELRQKFDGKLRITTSGERYVEICDPKGTKVRAMNELAQMLNIEPETIVAIGDNFNDIDMI